MSLIHLEKSVLTLHFKEILEDGHVGSPLALVGLSALIVAPKLLSNLTKPPRRAQRAPFQSGSPYRPYMGLSAWVAAAQKQQAPKQQAVAGLDRSPAPVAELPQVEDRLAA
jgi:hypothetical protein